LYIQISNLNRQLRSLVNVLNPPVTIEVPSYPESNFPNYSGIDCSRPQFHPVLQKIKQAVTIFLF
jgi:hypothetical protein